MHRACRHPACPDTPSISTSRKPNGDTTIGAPTSTKPCHDTSDMTLDIFEIEQFVALNLYEMGGFAAAGRRVAVGDLVARYDEIVEDVETDPSLRIEIRK